MEHKKNDSRHRQEDFKKSLKSRFEREGMTIEIGLLIRISSNVQNQRDLYPDLTAPFQTANNRRLKGQSSTVRVYVCNVFLHTFLIHFFSFLDSKSLE